MAIAPNPVIERDALFLINQDDTTYKVLITDVAKNIGDIIINGEDGSGDDPVLDIGDFGKINTSVYVFAMDDLGHPAQTRRFSNLPGTLTDINDDSDGKNHYWMLQWVNSKVSGSGTIHDADGEFVLRDPEDVFAEIRREVVENIELNDLNDVSTRVSADHTGDFREHTAGDSFLLCIQEYKAESGPGAGDAVLPQYQPRSLNAIIEEKFENGEINIDLDNIENVNPKPPVGDPLGKLSINTGKGTAGQPGYEAPWYPGAEDLVGADFIPKYRAEGGDLAFDDVLVYIDDPAEQIADVGAADSIPAGWFYAESAFGDSLERASSSTGDDSVDFAAGKSITMGGVRVLEYKDTELEDDGKGGFKIKKVGQRPSNIGITNEGVLFSNIPQTLTFVEGINVGLDTGVEKFFDGRDVPAQGPGDSSLPEVWDKDADPPALPDAGDFYVVRLLDSIGGAEVDSDLITHTLEWNDYYPVDSVEAGPDLIVRSGDLVAFGESQWSIIGRVNTDSVAQDLKNVTDVGNKTDLSIIIGRLDDIADSEIDGSTTLGDGILYVSGGRRKDGTLETGQEAYQPQPGDIHGKRLSVDELDWDGFELLAP